MFLGKTKSQWFALLVAVLSTIILYFLFQYAWTVGGILPVAALIGIIGGVFTGVFITDQFLAK